MVSITGGKLVSKINYRVCDICGNRIPGFEFDITGIAKRYINGCRIWNKLFNRLDICDDCIGKIKYLSIDKKDEEKYIKEVFDKAKDYDNPDMKSAYYQGIEDTMNVLSHKRLKNLPKLR